MKRIIVTGAAGFIGSNLCRKLLEHPNNFVTGIDDLSRGRIESLSQCTKNNSFFFHKQDLTDDRVERCFEDADEVYHLASVVGGINVYLDNPYTVFSKNVKIDQNVISACIKYKIKKIFYASSSHVYKTKPDKSPLTENDKIGSDLSYGTAKEIGEKTLQWAVQEKKLQNVAIGRLCGIYGPGQSYGANDGSLIPVMCARASKYPEVPFSILTNGEEERSFCYISDAIDAMVSMMENLNSNTLGPYNICREEKYSIKKVCDTISKISGKNVEVVLTDRKSLIDCQWCSGAGIFKAIGWKSKIQLDDGLKKSYYDVNNRITSENCS